MVDAVEWSWVRDRVLDRSTTWDHLVLCSTLPVLLLPGIHHLEGWNEAVAQGAWGRLPARFGEWFRQFLDLGSGIPTAGNVHEVAQSIDPSCKVVYVDHDPVTVAHARTMLRDNLNAAIVQSDVCDVGAVLRDPETRRLIDFTKPTAVLMVGILPYVSDEPAGVVARYRAALCEGSVLALTHLTKDVEPGLVDQLLTLSNEMGSALVPRSKQDVEDFVCGLKLLEPGLVLAAHWRADGELPGTSALADASTYGAVGVI